MLDESGDHGLALLAARGDRAAFERLVERHYDLIHRLGWRLLGNGTDAEDLAQDVCVTLARRIQSFDGRAKFTTWLYQVTLNAARDRMRRDKTRARATEGFAEVDGLRRGADAARAAEAEWLRTALDRLKPDLRETAVLVLDEEMTHAAAAEVLGCKESTISWRLMEIRKALKAMAETDEEIAR